MTGVQKVNSVNYYKHIGLYVYKKEMLMEFTCLEQTELELAEKLEQLRFLENGYKIRVVVTEHESLAVDTPEDLKKARFYYEKFVSKKNKN